MNVDIPGVARLRRMLPGERTLFAFRENAPRPDVAVGTVTARNGGKFETATRYLLDPNTMTLEKVCVVTCIEAVSN